MIPMIFIKILMDFYFVEYNPKASPYIRRISVENINYILDAVDIYGKEVCNSLLDFSDNVTIRSGLTLQSFTNFSKIFSKGDMGVSQTGDDPQDHDGGDRENSEVGAK